MDCRFYVGQRVVCVDATYDQDPRFSGRLDGLKEGATYTVRGVALPPPEWQQTYPDLNGNVWVFLQEIYRPLNAGDCCRGTEIGYRHIRFRPATDISALEELLRTTKTPELETT